MKAVFVDTAALIALGNKQDKWHTRRWRLAANSRWQAAALSPPTQSCWKQATPSAERVTNRWLRVLSKQRAIPRAGSVFLWTRICSTLRHAQGTAAAWPCSRKCPTRIGAWWIASALRWRMRTISRKYSPPTSISPKQG